MKPKINLLEGNIRSALIFLAIPIIGTTFMQMSYNLIDMIWVGRLGSDAVAAVGTAGFIINVGYAVNSLFITGASIKISHCEGRKSREEAEEYMSTGIIYVTLFSIIFTLVLIIFRNPIIEIFNISNGYVNAQASLYLAVFSLSLFFTFCGMFLSSIFYSLGDSKLPFKINMIGIVLNILLDPLFIFYFGWGIVGAAIGTIISNIIVFFILYYYLIKIHSVRFSLHGNYKKLLDIFKLGSPMAIQRVIFTTIGILIAIIIAKWGADAIAAQKIGLQIEAITYMSIGGLNRAVSIFVGQNYGAGQMDRIRTGYWTGIKLGVIIGFVMTLIFLIFPYQLMRIFVNDPETVRIGVSYLRIVGLSQIFMCIEMISNGALTGIGKPHIPAVISIVFTSLRIPLAIILSSTVLFGLNGVWMSISVSSFVKGIVSLTLIIIIFYGFRKSKSLMIFKKRNNNFCH
ncbi:MAG: MATE family efflux transporter [bacterium]|nr:MATE family efflux transporter [bacterium]